MVAWCHTNTIVPDPTNPLDWDRYSYVRNNPINYIDPTGHAQALPDDGGLPLDAIKNHLDKEYDWKTDGSFNVQQLLTIWDAAIELRHYVSTTRGTDGGDWIRTYLGGTTFYLGGLNDQINASMGPDAYSVFLMSGFENLTWQQTTPGMIIHELGHVLDNRIALYNPYTYLSTGPCYTWGCDGGNMAIPAVIGGGGPADALIEFLGGSPNHIRFAGGVNLPLPMQFAQQHSEGNKSSADYFAETLSMSVIDPAAVFPDARLWMAAFVSLLP